MDTFEFCFNGIRFGERALTRILGSLINAYGEACIRGIANDPNDLRAIQTLDALLRQRSPGLRMPTDADEPTWFQLARDITMAFFGREAVTFARAKDRSDPGKTACVWQCGDNYTIVDDSFRPPTCRHKTKHLVRLLRVYIDGDLALNLHPLVGMRAPSNDSVVFDSLGGSMSGRIGGK